MSTAFNDLNETEPNDTEKEMKDERIIGGRFANAGEVPYQVLLLNADGTFCGGALLDTDDLENRVVITAAHCIFMYDFYFKFIFNFVKQILK